MCYGCFPAKLAETLGKPKSEGQALFDKFWEVNEPIRLLVADLETAYDKSGGTIKGLDGRTLYVRAKRTLLNTLIQQAGACVFKKWMTLTDEVLPENVHQIIAMHDELIFEVNGSRQDAESCAKIVVAKAIEAGEFFNLRAKTTAEAMIGENYAEVH